MAMTAGTAYSPLMGAVYIFNLMVGTGALALPKAFNEAGYVGGSILLAVLAFFSYVTVTHVIEAMSIANAFLRKKSAASGQLQVEMPLLPHKPEPDTPFEITERTEMGQMAEMFFSKMGARLFYLVIAIYLYGDLCIYAVAVPKSLRQTACGNTTKAHSADDTSCMGHLDADGAYYIFLTLFAVLLGPFCFFNLQKTKFLQLFTTLMRWMSFLTMIFIAVVGIASGKGFNSGDHIPRPSEVPPVHPRGLPVLVGVAVYSFMCHHSIPSLLTPISDKSKAFLVFGADILLILGFYCLLCFTAVFRFSEHMLNSQDLYTLVFADFSVRFFAYFLELFPVFTLSASFPIIAITLRNNLQVLFAREKPYPPLVNRLLFPFLAIAPPIIVAFFTTDVEFLVGITGSYAGVGIQYVVPALLVFFARKMKNAPNAFPNEESPYRSPFSHTAWIVTVMVWSVACITIVTYMHISEGK